MSNLKIISKSHPSILSVLSNFDGILGDWYGYVFGFEKVVIYYSSQKFEVA
jgi:hypothetical protein